jgi:hypothetical protein
VQPQGLYFRANLKIASTFCLQTLPYF